MDEFVGKEVSKVEELGNGSTVIYFTDGSFIICTGPVVTSLDLELPEGAAEPEDKPEKGKKDKKAAAEPEPADYTWDDLKDMDYDELSELADDEGIDHDDFDDDEDEAGLRKAIAKELDIEVPKKGKK